MSVIKIINRSIKKVAWITATSPGAILNNNANVWRVNISSNLYRLEYFKAILQTGEIARAHRYLQVKDQNRFIVSRGALRHVLGMYLNRPPASIEFKEGVNKKPGLADAAGLRYNVSHSGDWVLIGIANSEIGVDVEFVNQNFEFGDIMNDIFTPDEISYVKQVDSLERFYMFWTRKEALTKATAQGLDENFKVIPGLDGRHRINDKTVLSGDSWQINSFELSENYIASAAVGSLIKEIRFWDIDFKFK
jgi:4'-phosphopantetheinyl transferase